MSLDYFEKFIVKAEKETSVNNNVWVYTRVSSKDQEVNKSLKYQKKFAEEYAHENGLMITKYFGATYESAKGDFTRKEFKKLITEVSKTKDKPFAILIYKMNRFSRSGANAIALTNELVHQNNVHLIEVNSGISTETQDGEYQILKKLLRARKENLERMEHTLPGMKTFLEDGNYLGRAPLGYTLKGTRVTEFSRRSERQQIEISEDGKLLKKAWLMKADGEQDHIIQQEMAKYGLNISKQKLSAMWRKATYCGISTNKLLDKPVKGNWKPIVSIVNFKRVQAILDTPRNKGYQISKQNFDRPLTGFLKCMSCNNKLTSYEVKKKKLHYYTCQKCKGVTLNANSSKRSLKKGVHDTFIELLESFKLDKHLIEPFKAQIKLLLKNHNNDKYELKETIEKRIKALNTKSQKLVDKLMNDIIDDYTYKSYKEQIDKELLQLNVNLKSQSKKISNLDDFVNSIIVFSQNISKYWALGSFEIKTKLQELIFPNGLMINPKNRQYLTNEINFLFALNATITRDLRVSKNEKASINTGLSCLVAGTGLEPVTFGL
ncbi:MULTISPECIES: recombinase family protein [Aquimarina]|uniref:recombinase family protein n=1 Tax=Aquimarina TaxID=290174 RepID=UPI00040BB609|nr:MULTISPECIES: recombinase family protein [Aquimarina]